MTRGTLFKPTVGPGSERPRTSRQSIRGRISAPIPVSDALEHNEKPVHNVAGVPGVLDVLDAPGAVRESGTSSMAQTERAASFDPEPIEAAPIAAPVENPKAVAEADTSDPRTATLPPASAVLRPHSHRATPSSLREAGSSSPASGGLSKTPPLQPSPASTPQPRHAANRPGNTMAAGLAAVSESSAAATGGGAPGSERISPAPAFRHRAHPSSTLRYSEASALSEGPRTSQGGSGGIDTRPQRKRSGFRGAFSKLFGRRKQTDSLPPSSPALHFDSTPQHRSVRSDPTVLGRPIEATEPKRSTSLPLTEYGRALRSHSIGPGSMSIIESVRASEQADGPSADPEEASRGRTLTAASRMRIVQQLRRGGYGSSGDILGSGGEWAGLSPRPASVHGRGTRNTLLSGGRITDAIGERSGGAAAGRGDIGAGAVGSVGAFGAGGDAVHRADEIGRAISSDMPGASEFGHKRRSRSLSGLRDLAFGRDQSRRRSDEIRYWRESYDPALRSPLSSGHDFDVDADVDADDDADDDADGPNTHVGRTGDDGAEDQDGEEDTRDRVRRHSGSPSDFLGLEGLSGTSPQILAAPSSSPDTPEVSPQPFSFGNLSSVGATSGLPKLAQTASVDSRLGVLESRMHHVEHVVDQLCHAVASLKEPSASARSFVNSTSPYAPPPLPKAATRQPYAASTSTKNRFAPAASSRCSSRHSDRSGHSSVSFDSDMHHSHLSFGEGRTYIGSLHPPSSSATQVKPSAPPAFLAASTATFSPQTSAATVREAASLPTLGASTVRSASPAATAELVMQLESERAARQTLEAQVKKLNDRINNLSTTMYAMVRDPAAKRQRSHEPLSSPMSSTGSFRDNASVASPTALSPSVRPPLPLVKGQQQTVASPGAAPTTKTPGGKPQQMPLGEIKPKQPTQEEGSADPSGGDSPKRQKKTARTLSLGQLTLGKGAVRT